MDYQIILRACESRKEYVPYLKNNIKDLFVVWDNDNNAMHTFLRALLFAGNNAAVHIEDDIILTSNFKEKLDKVIQSRPKNVIQFFSMRKADIEVGSRWDYASRFMMCQCFYFPPLYSKLLYEYHNIWPKKKQQPRSGYDLLISDFLKSRKEKYWIHIPNLVDHRSVRSVINSRRSRSRQSKTFEL